MKQIELRGYKSVPDLETLKAAMRQLAGPRVILLQQIDDAASSAMS
jgi:hypothetical protein